MRGEGDVEDGLGQQQVVQERREKGAMRGNNGEQRSARTKEEWVEKRWNKVVSELQRTHAKAELKEVGKGAGGKR